MHYYQRLEQDQERLLLVVLNEMNFDFDFDFDCSIDCAIDFGLEIVEIGDNLALLR